MDMKIFTSSNRYTPFELGGLEFFGRKQKFTKSDYSNQDLQMVFISLVNFSFAMRERKSKFIMSSGIVFSYNKKGFFVNEILIDKILYASLLKCLYLIVEESIFLLRASSVSHNDPVLLDLNQELTSLSLTMKNMAG
jgi:tRNA-binding EMAP/Myf-like protein